MGVSPLWRRPIRTVWQEFFAANWVIILSIYGQVFFVLGLAIALQSWRHSRLTLARNLKWLAAFGFTHSFHEWGDIFIPLQAQYIAAPFIELLLSAQVILLALSFACLYQFGIEILRPLPGRWLRAIPLLSLLLWLWWSLGWAPFVSTDKTSWHHLTILSARYALGVPAALLAAYGLRHQAQNLIAPLQVDHAVRALRLASAALVGYAIMGGLIVAPADFFPANWLNTTRLEQITLIPVPVYRSLFGLLLAFAIIRALNVFHVELDRRLAALEEKQLLLGERERIGRELHDGTLQKVYAAGLLLRALEREMVRDGDNAVLQRVRESADLLNQTVADIRSYIGDLRLQPSSHSLMSGLQEIANAGALRSLVEVDLEMAVDEDRPLSPVYTGHLLAIANEALSNVMRHAGASRVHIRADSSAQRLHLRIEDNGCGLPADYVIGYGLRNMRERARLLDGELTVTSRPGKGTVIDVRVPWSECNEYLTVAVG